MSREKFMKAKYMSHDSPARRVARFAVLCMLAGAFMSIAPTRAAPAPPKTEKRPVTDQFYGQSVTEDYRWLENWSDPTVHAWVDAQNTVTRGTLDSLTVRPQILKRVEALTQNATPRYFGLTFSGGVLFALKDQPPKNQPMLVRLESVDDLSKEKMLLDPNALDASGATTIDFYEPSIDGSKVAVSLSKGGTESGDVHFFDSSTGKALPDVLPRVNGGTAGGSVAWTADGKGIFYTRYPASGERPDADLDFYQQVYYHVFGTAVATDRYVMGKDFPKIAEVLLQSSDDGKRMLIEVLNGDGGEHAFWLRGTTGKITPVCGFQDRIVRARFSPNALIMLSRRESPNGAILKAPLDHADLAGASVIVPASDTAIDGFQIAGKRLYVQDIVGGPSEVRMFDFDGNALGKLPLPPVCSVEDIQKFGGDQVLIERASYTEPTRWMRYDPASGGLIATSLEMKSAADFSDVEVRREFAVSKDGTKIPINILMKKGTVPDGHTPVLLYGYGGYGLSQKPNFSPTRKLWIEQGGIFAVANIRGGGEYGDAWHLAGNLTKKQNVFDDFSACAQHMIDAHYTTSDKLACQGGSNGGLLMGAMITQHPQQFGAVISSVGVYDMLRVETSPNGLFNVTEYGSVKDSAQFRALLGYSPYHNIHDGTQYPSCLLLTGVNDPRVSPYNSFKFAARLQATGTAKPILLRTSYTTGHIGSPLSARQQESADIYSFLFSQLGLTYKPVSAPAP
jgi:prolyl oligopeptidase